MSSVNVAYANLNKNDPFIVTINGKDYVYLKFSNSWAKPENGGNWLSMLSTEMVGRFDASSQKAKGIESI